MDPEMAQWQQRFDATLRMAQTPRRPGESPSQFQQRQAQANQALRAIQSSKPIGQETAPGRPASPPQPALAPGRGGGIGGVFNYITDALRRANGN